MNITIENPRETANGLEGNEIVVYTFGMTVNGPGNAFIYFHGTNFIVRMESSDGKTSWIYYVESQEVRKFILNEQTGNVKKALYTPKVNVSRTGNFFLPNNLVEPAWLMQVPGEYIYTFDGPYKGYGAAFHTFAYFYKRPFDISKRELISWWLASNMDKPLESYGFPRKKFYVCLKSRAGHETELLIVKHLESLVVTEEVVVRIFPVYPLTTKWREYYEFIKRTETYFGEGLGQPHSSSDDNLAEVWKVSCWLMNEADSY